jgi:hypothetical protein
MIALAAGKLRNNTVSLLMFLLTLSPRPDSHAHPCAHERPHEPHPAIAPTLNAPTATCPAGGDSTFEGSRGLRCAADSPHIPGRCRTARPAETHTALTKPRNALQSPRNTPTADLHGTGASMDRRATNRPLRSRVETDVNWSREWRARPFGKGEQLRRRPACKW